MSRRRWISFGDWILSRFHCLRMFFLATISAGLLIIGTKSTSGFLYSCFVTMSIVNRIEIPTHAGTRWPNSPPCSPRAACTTATPLQIYQKKENWTKKQSKEGRSRANEHRLNQWLLGQHYQKYEQPTKALIFAMDVPQTEAQPLLKSSRQSISFPLIHQACIANIFHVGNPQSSGLGRQEQGLG